MPTAIITNILHPWAIFVFSWDLKERRIRKQHGHTAALPVEG